MQVIEQVAEAAQAPGPFPLGPRAPVLLGPEATPIGEVASRPLTLIRGLPRRPPGPIQTGVRAQVTSGGAVPLPLG